MTVSPRLQRGPPLTTAPFTTGPFTTGPFTTGPFTKGRRVMRFQRRKPSAYRS